MPQKDEFGGIAVDESDEFGGTPVADEPSPEFTPVELTQDAGPYGRVTVPQVFQTEFGPISNQPKTQSLEEARHETFAGLKPTGREVQNAYDFAKGFIPMLGGGVAPEPEPDRPVSDTAKIAAGVIGGGVNLAETFSTPEGIALTFAGNIPGILGRAVSAGFLAQMFQQAPAVYQKLGDAFGKGDKTAEAEAVVDAIAHGAFTAGTAHGAFRGASPKAIRDWAREFVSKTPPEERAKVYNVEPTPQTIEPGASAEPTPEPQVETRTQEVFNGNPVEVLEVNKKKGTALVRPEGQPDAAPDVVPYGEIETREVPVEKGPNASEIRKTAEVYGDVRSQPGEGPGEVPIEESGGGIQSQTSGRVRQAEGQNREVSLAEQESGWTSSPTKQISGIKVESLTPEELAKIGGTGKEIEFTDRRPGSITEGSTLYFPKDATKAEIISRMDEELSKKVANLTAEQWQAYAGSLHKSDIGREAVTRRLGDSAEEGGFVNDLKTKADEIANRRQEELKKAREAKSPDEAVRYIERGGLLSDQAQFFNEAHEFARASAQGKILPLSELKGEVPEKSVPIKVQRADGTTYEAFLVAAPGSKKAGTRIAKVKADTQGLSDGVLGKGDKIIEGPKTAAEYKAATAVAEPIAEPIAKAQEQVTEVSKTEGKRSAKAVKEELISRLEEALKEAKPKTERTYGDLVKVTIDIPGDGTFKVWNTTEAIQAMIDAAKRLNTSSGVGNRRPPPVNVGGRVDAASRGTRDVVDAVRVYGSEAEAYRRLSSQVERSQELELEPEQTQRLARVVERLKNTIEEPYQKARRRVSDAEDRLEFLRKQFGEKHKSVRDLEKNLKAYQNEEAAAKIKRDEALGEKPASGNVAEVIGAQPAYAGIPLPNLAGLGPAVRQTLTSLNRTRKALQTIWKASPNRNIMDQTIDAADNKANIAGRAMGNRLRIGTGRMQRMATMAVVEANGDPQRLQQFEQQAIAGGNQDAIDAVRYAQREWTRLQADAARVTRILDGQIAAEQNADIATEYRDAYVPHIYDRDLLMGSGRPFVIAGGTGMGNGFKKGRTFATIFDAIELGYKPKTMDVADLVEHRVKVGQKIINRKSWAESLQSITDPTDGNPIAAPLIRKSRGPSKPSYEVAPSGYRPMEILPGVRIGIHEAYLPLFRALTGESWVSGSVPGKLLLEAAGGIKHGLLVFDSFHASRIFQKLLTLAPGKVLSGKAGYERGFSLLEYADSDLAAAQRENLITPEIATWVRANRPNARLLIDNGLNVGRIQEGLYNSVVRQIPGIGTFNKWVFEKLTRGALMEAGLLELERVSAAKPGVPRGTIAAEVARNLNAYFGNLGRQGLFKSASSRDIARLVALAPQWVESMARTELKGAAQIAKGVTYDPIVHKTLLTGSIGKGVAQGLLAYFVGTQILNYITRGHSTFQNPEDNHKLDAWIPGPKGSHGFFLSPFSVVAELTHDMLRYSSKEPSKWDAAMRIAGNKASPMTRALKVLMTGRDYDGKQITDTWARVKAAAFALAPTPIPLAPVIKGSQYPGQLQRQLTASAGFKTEPAESAAQQVAHKAQQFLQAKGKKPVALELTDEPAFYKLRDAIRKDDESGAKDILAALRKTHSDLNIFEAMQGHISRPFTDSLRHEGEFRRSLSPREQDLYRKARDEQREEFQKFKELWYKRRE